MLSTTVSVFICLLTFTFLFVICPFVFTNGIPARRPSVNSYYDYTSSVSSHLHKRKINSPTAYSRSGRIAGVLSTFSFQADRSDVSRAVRFTTDGGEVYESDDVLKCRLACSESIPADDRRSFVAALFHFFPTRTEGCR